MFHILIIAFNQTELEVDFEDETEDIANTRELDSVEVNVNLFESGEITIEETEATYDYDIEADEEEIHREDSETGSISTKK